MSTDNVVNTLIDKLYGDKESEINHLSEGVDGIPSVMGTGPRNQRELSEIRHNGYSPVRAAEIDSHRFGYHELGTPQAAINKAEGDIKDLKTSQTVKRSDHYRADLQFDRKIIKKDQTMPNDTLVMISQFNNGQVVRLAKATDIEMIYHNTHDSGKEITQRHPDCLFYTKRDAEIDAKQDLK